MLANRLKKRYKHLAKWARRQNIDCFRIYHRDIPEYPLTIDWYAGNVVIWIWESPKSLRRGFQEAIEAEIAEGLEIDLSTLFIKDRRRQKGSQQYEKMESENFTDIVHEFGLKFEVNLSDYLDTGLFLDHRMTRKMVAEDAADKSLLNLFAYTGAFSVHAAAAGARTTTVDMSNTYLQWGERNFTLNEIAPTAHSFIQRDCLAFLREEAATTKRYDIIVCDPPTFSNSKRMDRRFFAVDKDYPELINGCLKLLTPGGQLFFSNNSTKFKLDAERIASGALIKEISKQTISEDFRHGGGNHRCWKIQKEQ